MPEQQYLNPNSMSQPRGYTQVVKVANTVYIAGQVSVAEDGSVVGKGDASTQARQVWHNLEAAVKSVGDTLQNIIKSTTYVTSIEYGVAVREVRTELYQSSSPPTSTLLVMPGLANPDFCWRWKPSQ